MTSGWIRRVGVLSVLLVASLEGDAQPQVAINFGGNGLSSISFAGSELLESGELRVHRIDWQDSSGSSSPAPLNGSVNVDRGANQITNTYSWGTVSARYQVQGNRLDVTLTVANRADKTIRAVSLEPFELRLPSKPAEYDNVTPLMIYDPGRPGVVSLTTPETTVVLSHEDHGKAIVAGFKWADDRPTSTRFPFSVITDRDGMLPDSYPTVHRPIPPGGSDSYRFALRFAQGDVGAEGLAAEVYSSFATTFPQTLAWTDKRPIGQLVLATAATGYATNPRGWLLDPTIDVTTPAGLAAFRTRVLAWADQSVAILKEINAQGMITWDIEGEQHPHSTTYLCDPRVLAQAAPEMEPIADEYFRRFSSAGLRVGVCVRPQTLVLDGQNARQEESPDPYSVLNAKIVYAKSRWGATIFYIDSNGDPNLPLDADVMRRLTEAHPDVLLVPEHENTRYYAYSAPYRELRQGQVSTPDDVRSVYPSAFGVTYVADADMGRYFDELLTAVRRGDVLMTRAWFADPANDAVRKIHAQAPPSAPTNLHIIRGAAQTGGTTAAPRAAR